MIRKRGNRFVVELYDPVRARKVTVKPGDLGVETPTTRNAAKELERLAIQTGYASHGAMTVAQYAELHCDRAYTDNGRPIQPQTNRHNRSRIAKFVEKYGDEPMPKISRPQAKQFVAEYPSRAREVAAMFRAALSDDVIKTNPFQGLRPPQRKGGKKKLLVPSLNQVLALSEAAVVVHGAWGVIFRAMILFTAWTGLRPGEAAGAQWKYLDLEASKFDVQCQWHLHECRLVAPKWDSFGLVHVFEPGLDAVKDLERTTPFMFPAKRGGKLNGHKLHDALDPVRHLAGVPDLTFKALRHFHASYLLNELGLPPYTIAQQLRHSDGGELIVSTYGHADRDIHLERIAASERGASITGSTSDSSAI